MKKINNALADSYIDDYLLNINQLVKQMNKQSNSFSKIVYLKRISKLSEKTIKKIEGINQKRLPLGDAQLQINFNSKGN